MTARATRETVSFCPTCRFTSKQTTRDLAAYALRRHSCTKHLEAAARRANGDRMRASRGTIIRPCLHKRANHQHGTNAAYHLDNCRCLPCSRAAVAYDRRRSRQQAYGRWQPFVEAEPVRHHVRQLMAVGVGWKRIARHAQVPSGVMTKLLYGDTTRKMQPSRRIRPETAQRILAVQPDAIAAGARIPAGQTWRHIQGLVALGYPFAWISNEIGQGGRALQIGQDLVRVRTANLIADLAARVGDTPGHSLRARRYAEQHGWLTPMQQFADATTSDDNDVRPPTRAEILRENAEWLIDGGLSVELTAERLNVRVDYLRDVLAGKKGGRAA